MTDEQSLDRLLKTIYEVCGDDPANRVDIDPLLAHLGLSKDEGQKLLKLALDQNLAEFLTGAVTLTEAGRVRARQK